MADNFSFSGFDDISPRENSEFGVRNSELPPSGANTVQEQPPQPQIAAAPTPKEPERSAVNDQRSGENSPPKPHAHGFFPSGNYSFTPPHAPPAQTQNTQTPPNTVPPNGVNSELNAPPLPFYMQPGPPRAQNQTPPNTIAQDGAYSTFCVPHSELNPSPPVSNPYPGFTQGDISGEVPNPQFQAAFNKPKKTKTTVGVGSLIACTLVSALIAGGGASAFFAVRQADSLSGSTAAGDTVYKTINIEDTAPSTAAAVAEKVAASVVGIRTTGVTQSIFGSQTSTGEGSGVIYTADGYLITNYHVIESGLNGGAIEVFLPGDTTTAIKAAVIGYDPESDLAVLKIEKTGLPAIEIGDSDSLVVGQNAFAVGNPGGLDFMGSVSAGIISGLNRDIQMENSDSLIQTDAAINPGNSGGALVDQNGKLIGINSVKIVAEGFEGMGFAIPVNSVVEICNQIIEQKDQPKPYIGIQISSQYDEETLRSMGYPAGVVVQSVVSGGPADGSGIKRGDIITKLAGNAVKNYNAFISEKNRHKPGETVTVTVYRNGQYADCKVTLGESST
ncbi:MAG: trypsin-like peptidase domain-containing protein [Oscillospiraceae bacterium]|nr:trypsin-like peptidase domain-containing protein [Oscillospiraceae bacterium]